MTSYSKGGGSVVVRAEHAQCGFEHAPYLNESRIVGETREVVATRQLLRGEGGGGGVRVRAEGGGLLKSLCPETRAVE